MAFASTYVLDYVGKDEMRDRARRHYRRAMDILDKRLEEVNSGEIDDQKTERIVGSIILLNAHDVSLCLGAIDIQIHMCCILRLWPQIVTWETRREKGQIPRWLEGSQLASELLDATAAHRNYTRMENVQNDSIRGDENSM